MGRSSTRHAREFYGSDAAGNVAADFSEAASPPHFYLLVVPSPTSINTAVATSTPVVVNVKNSAGTNMVGVQLNVLSDDVAVCTVATPAPTDASGNTTVTVTHVAQGTTTVRVFLNGVSLYIPVTLT